MRREGFHAIAIMRSGIRHEGVDPPGIQRSDQAQLG
jgi:hypothetical protein